MRILLIIICLIGIRLHASGQRSLEEIHDRIKDSQLSDEKFKWKHFGTLNFEVVGTQNSGDYKLNIDAGTTVRMYLLAKTDCITYFDVRDPQTRYVFGSNNKNSLETEVEGFKATTAVYTYEKDATMVIRFGVRWGCPRMLRTKLKLLVFYQVKETE
ncbi:hypothetical protein [Roseivirga sp.]|uniref:hypothetical protein n=1 Tax=Roseivirga sp. TaxID=1964215 RepID=UPI002B2651D6|nr:hypothetical protein [Roseivirga sp.]